MNGALLQVSRFIPAQNAAPVWDDGCGEKRCQEYTTCGRDDPLKWP
jgi:hypothetical protein